MQKEIRATAFLLRQHFCAPSTKKLCAIWEASELTFAAIERTIASWRRERNPAGIRQVSDRQEGGGRNRMAAKEFRAPAIFLDMDGSIADLYGVEGWLEALQSENAAPYADAQPLCDMAALRRVLQELKAQNYIIGIISWSSKTGSPKFHKAIRKAKLEWLQKHNLLDVCSHIHIQRYGTPKSAIAQRHTTLSPSAILIDDEARNRVEWWEHKGTAIDPTETNLIEELQKLAQARNT